MLNKNSNNDNDTRDKEAEAEAAEAPRRGTEVIEGHLSQHMEQNPDSSFVTWVACLHPENAEVTIAERFLVPGNPWWTVYEGAKGEVPTATAVPVQEESASPTATSNALTIPDGRNKSYQNPATTAPPEDVSNFNYGIDLLIGCILSIVAIVAVFSVEAAAYAIYWISAGFYRMAQAMEPPNVATGIFYSIFLLVYYSLALVDSTLLIASVLTTEIVAFSLFLVSFIFAGLDMASRWHQYVRRTCHLLRWAFRSQSLSAHPPRNLCFVCLPKDIEEDKEEDQHERENQVVGAMEDPKWGEATVASVPTENWIEAGRTSATVTPSAPPAEAEAHVIVLDESNIIVDKEGKDSLNEKDDDIAWLRD